MSFPKVHDNERIIPTDFTRQTEAIEDLFARLVERLISPPQNGRGIVIEGCKPSSAADLANPRQVRITAGWALLPASAGAAGWRLVHVPAALLKSPDANPTGRTDCICLSMIRVDEAPEQREFRVLDNAGVESVDVRAEAVQYRVEGDLVFNKGAGAVPAVGTVRLGSVTVNNNGTITVADLRDHPFPAPTYNNAAWHAGASEGGRFWRTAGHAVSALAGALKQVVTSAGALQRTLATSDGGPPIIIDIIGLAHAMNLGARDLLLRAMTAASNIVSTNGNIVAESGDTRGERVGFVNEGNDAYNVDPAGRTMTPGNIQRAVVHVDMDIQLEPEEIVTARFAGQNVTSVVRVEPGHYLIKFDMNQFPSGLNDRRWRVAVQPNRSIFGPDTYPTLMETAGIIWQVGSGPTDDSIELWFFAVNYLDPVTVVTEAHEDIGGDVQTSTTQIFPTQISAIDTPFSVHLYGPLPSGNYDWEAVGSP
jgi:hypothetical protein